MQNKGYYATEGQRSFVWYKNVDKSFFCFVTNHAFDRQTDRILIARQRLHSMQHGKNVKDRLDDINDNILDRIGKRSLLQIGRKSKRWIGHTSMQGGLLLTVLQVAWKAKLEKKKDLTSVGSYEKLKRLTVDKR